MTDIQSLISALKSGDDAQAEAAVDEITFLGSELLPALLDVLDSPNPNNRWWALRALAVIRDPQVPMHLREALSDPDYTIRQCAALGLSHQTDVDSIPDLIAALDDKDRLVVRLAGDALTAIGGPAVMALIETLENGSNGARIEAARALAVIGDTRAIPAMFTVWENGSALIRHWVETGFERMGVGMQFFQPE
jgi:HEAT repeat protein